MKTQKRSATALSLILGALVLVSCGGGGEREALETMIRAATVDTGPGSCSKNETQHFLESMYRREGDAAVRACEERALDPLQEQPRSVDVSQVDVGSDSAAAVLAFEGSLLDGQKVRYRFVKREGRWKFDEMVGFVDLDAEHLILEAGRDAMLRAETSRQLENISCWIDRMERMSDSALEELLLGNRDVSPNCTAESNAI